MSGSFPLAALCLGLWLVAPLRAGAEAEALFLDRAAGGGPALTGPGCEGGLQYDDGGFEGAVGWTNATLNGTYVMRFDLPLSRQMLDSVCLCWTRSAFADVSDIGFELVVYGPGIDGQPGPPVATLPVSANAVPVFDTGGGRLYRYDLRSAGINAAQGPLFVGARWVPFVHRQFFLCNDSSPGTPLQDAFSSADGGITWTAVSELRPSYRALLIRLGIQPLVPAPLPIVAPILALLLLGLGLGVLRLRRKRRLS